MYLSWLFLGALRGAGEGAGVVSGALANLDLVVNVVALNGEGHGGTLGHTLKHNSIFTRPFDSQIPTQLRFDLFGKKIDLACMDVASNRVLDGDLSLTVPGYILADMDVSQLGRVHHQLHRSPHGVLETENS